MKVLLEKLENLIAEYKEKLQESENTKVQLSELKPGDMFMCFPSYLMLTSDALILLQLFFDVSGEVTGSGHNGKYGAVPHSVVT